MNGVYLPTSVEVDGKAYKIDSDFRTALYIMELYDDRAISHQLKHHTMLGMFYTTLDEETGELVTDIPENLELAVKAAFEFLDYEDEYNKTKTSGIKTMDFKKDRRMIMSAVSEVSTKYDDIREAEYIHWHTFVDMCQKISGESQLGYIINLRYKLAKGEKLTDDEQKFYKNNSSLVSMNISNSSTNDSKITKDTLKSLFGSNKK